LVSEGAHIKWYETGAAAALAGVQLVTVGQGGCTNPSGLFSAAEVEASYCPSDGDQSAARMAALCIENTHNRGGGRVWPQQQLAAVCATARRLRLRLHLDGARLWNAAVHLGVAPKEICAPFDTVSVCLSKGLGAPVGSLLCGSRADISAARRFRKMYGGSMRQAGLLAAAGLYALRHHYDRLAEDHENARLIVEALSALSQLRVVSPVETNIVLFDLLEGAPDAATLLSALRARGVLGSAFGPRRVRLVTHLDVDRAACLRAAAAIKQALHAAG
jgi:threonine aldolase